MNIKSYLTLLLGLSAIASNAEILLPDIISDHMVLQQQAQTKLWGWSKPGETITVSPDWIKALKVKANADGYWEVVVETPTASDKAYTISFKDSDSDISVRDVLMGEVWLCSGQSNMQMPLKGFPWQPVENSLEAIATSGNYPMIRMANIGHRRNYEPQETVDGKWLESKPENAAEFSATGYFFARRLNEILHIPVGIINCSYGGSKVEGWLPKWKLDEYPDIDVEKEKATPDSILRGWDRSNVMYNAMLHPLTRYAVKGFAWNQGEANVGKHKDYAMRLADMVKIWRDEWGLGNLPFLIVEIPAWHYNDPDGSSAAFLREAQRESVKIIPDAKVVSTVDLVYPHEYYDIHASKKQEIGDRLAYAALSDTYGIKGIPSVYPTFRSMEVKGNIAKLTFNDIEGGMTPHKVIEGFEVAGPDHKFYPAQATADRDTHIVTVSCDSVEKIESVRYCFKNFAIGKLHSTNGLPLLPFRTDNWDK